MGIAPEIFNEGLKMKYSSLMGNCIYAGFRMVITCSNTMNNFKDMKANCQQFFKSFRKLNLDQQQLRVLVLTTTSPTLTCFFSITNLVSENGISVNLHFLIVTLDIVICLLYSYYLPLFLLKLSVYFPHKLLLMCSCIDL